MIFLFAFENEINIQFMKMNYVSSLMEKYDIEKSAQIWYFG